MPFIHALVSSPRLDDALAAEIAATLTDLSGRRLAKVAAVTAVVVQPVAATAWFVGARSLADLGAASFQVTIRVTEGTNDKAQKADFIAAASAAMVRLLGPSRPESYVIVDEVRADAWAWDGVTQEHRAVAAKIAREEERATVFDAYRRFGIR
jgi:4-oxalocrotonate tautomerase